MKYVIPFTHSTKEIPTKHCFKIALRIWYKSTIARKFKKAKDWHSLFSTLHPVFQKKARNLRYPISFSILAMSDPMEKVPATTEASTSDLARQGWNHEKPYVLYINISNFSPETRPFSSWDWVPVRPSCSHPKLLLVQTQWPEEGRDAVHKPKELLPKACGGHFPFWLWFRGWGDPGAVILPVSLLPSLLAPSSLQNSPLHCHNYLRGVGLFSHITSNGTRGKGL